jgi:hypothetical protein
MHACAASQLSLQSGSMFWATAPQHHRLLAGLNNQTFDWVSKRQNLHTADLPLCSSQRQAVLQCIYVCNCSKLTYIQTMQIMRHALALCHLHKWHGAHLGNVAVHSTEPSTIATPLTASTCYTYPMQLCCNWLPYAADRNSANDPHLRHSLPCQDPSTFPPVQTAVLQLAGCVI